jgi:thiosulfate/3-mercaptopyruvate sulfurtransferase
VVYDDSQASSAARLWWLLHALDAPVALLDGGLQAWPGLLSTAETTRPSVARTVRPWPTNRFWDADRVSQGVQSAGTLVLDARSATRFAEGDPAFDPRPGHIPGARSAPWSDNIDPSSGRFLSRVELHQRFVALGAARAPRILAYCGSGVTACHDLLALELAGFHDTALYPGSWSAWAADQGRPAKTGPEP